MKPILLLFFLNVPIFCSNSYENNDENQKIDEKTVYPNQPSIIVEDTLDSQETSETDGIDTKTDKKLETINSFMELGGFKKKPKKTEDKE